MSDHPAAAGTTPGAAGRRLVPDTVLFDVDGTLQDSNYWLVLAWHRAFADADCWQPGCADPFRARMAEIDLRPPWPVTRWSTARETTSGRHGSGSTTAT